MLKDHDSMFESYLKVASANDRKATEARALVDAMKTLPADMLFKLANGEMKLAYFGDKCVSGSSGSTGNLEWIEQFKDTPMFEQALQLEQQAIQIEQMQQQHEAQRSAERDQEPKFWEMQDHIRLQKRLLGLQLASSQLQQAGAGMAPHGPGPEAGPAAPPPSTTEAAGGAAPSPVDGKVAGVLSALALPAAVGGIAGGVRGNEHDRPIEGALRGAAGAAGGALFGGLGGGALGGALGLGAGAGLEGISQGRGGAAGFLPGEAAQSLGLGGLGVGSLVGGLYGGRKGYQTAMEGVARPHEAEERKKEAAPYKPSPHVQELEETDKYVSPALAGIGFGGLGALPGLLKNKPGLALAGAGVGAGAGVLADRLLMPKLKAMGERHIMSGEADDQLHANNSGALGAMNKHYLENFHGKEGPIYAGMHGLLGATAGGMAGHEIGGSMGKPGLGAAIGAAGGGLLAGGMGYLGGKHIETGLARNQDLQDQRRAQPDYKHKDKEGFDRAASMGQKMAQLDYGRAITTNTAAEFGSDLAKTALDVGSIAGLGQKAVGFLGKNPGAAVGTAVGAAGGLAHGLQKDQNGQRSLLRGAAEGVAGGVAGAAVGHGAQHFGQALQHNAGNVPLGQNIMQSAGAAARQVGYQGEQAVNAVRNAVKPGSVLPAGYSAPNLKAAPASGAALGPSEDSIGTRILPRAGGRVAPTQPMTGAQPAPPSVSGTAPTQAMPQRAPFGTLQSPGATPPPAQAPAGRVMPQRV